MKILLINNGTQLLKELKALLREHQVKIVKPDGLDSTKAEDFDLIVLSGGSGSPIMDNQDLYRQEMDLIKHCKQPIVGICLGFELICYAYGSRLKRIDKKRTGVISLRITGHDNVLEDLPNLNVYEAHRWVVEKPPHELVELARSDDGIEAVKHKKRRVYGFQFHPEMFTERTCGDEIFNKLLDVLKTELKTKNPKG